VGPMSSVKFEEGAVCIDATIIAQGLAIQPALVQPLMRKGTLTSLCERGLDRDAGKVRLTFFYGRRRLRLIVDLGGNVIERSVTHIRGRGGRGAMRESDLERRKGKAPP
jgi:hypothetical protein